MSNHLKPCPFCGGDASFNEHTDSCYFTVLRKLKADPPADLSRVPDLIEAWNTRTVIQQAEAKTDEPVGYMNAGQLYELQQGRAPYGYIYPQSGVGADIEIFTHPAPGVQDGYVLVRGLVEHIELNTCTHEETHRGGAIWEVCDSCGARWADDEGGKPTFKWPPIVEKARAELAAAQAQKGQP